MLSFDNTEIAFSGKNNNDLNRSYWLFRLISNPVFVNVGQALSSFAIRVGLPIKSIIKATIFKQFVGGENIEECNKTIERLGQFNIGTILDYAVEGKDSEQDFDNCAREIIATADKAKGNKNIPFCVFKITGVARFAILEKVSSGIALTDNEKQEFSRIRSRINSICKRSYENGVRLFIDAEESWVQQAMDDLVNEMMSLYNKERVVVFNTFQLYRKDRLAYLKKTFELAQNGNFMVGAKLVRGAYLEKERERAIEKNYPSPVHNTTQETDESYDAALEFCIEHIDRIAFCAGTHNESSSLHLVDLMKKKNISNNNSHVFFSQLLGMSDHISYNLANAGYRVAKYVPYGPVKEVLPYLIRRAQENTSVKGQSGRELSLIIKEKSRRKMSIK
ncbi:MAG: proline dehydrogenase family protein [Bacteroidia bacterium]|nr:proline dehydrogenase family protein [Bacteroidia bacterium]